MRRVRQQVPRVLIVGWGFLGAALGGRLLAGGHSVIALTRSESARVRAGRQAGARVIVSDGGDRRTLRDLVDDVDHVVFAVGGHSPLSTALNPALEAMSSLVPLISLLEELRFHPGIGLTYLSSGGTVYGDPLRLPVRETDPVRPISQYGVSRAAGEMYVQMYATTFGVPAQIIRCANVYGPGQRSDGEQGIVAVFLHRVAAGLAVRIAGDGSAVRDFVFIDDVTATVEQLINKQMDVGLLNVGSGCGHTVLEVLDVVQRVVGRSAVVEFHPPPRHQVHAVVLDVTKLRSLIAYSPIVFEEGVRSSVPLVSRNPRQLVERIALRTSEVPRLVAEHG